MTFQLRKLLNPPNIVDGSTMILNFAQADGLTILFCNNKRFDLNINDGYLLGSNQPNIVDGT